MIKINPQLEKIRQERGEATGTRHELFPHLYNEKGERVQKCYIDFNVERCELIFEADDMTPEEIYYWVGEYIKAAKAGCAQMIASQQKRLAALEAL